MNALMQTNIDDIRERIMRLESAPTFDQLAWDMVLADLRAAGRLSAVTDAERRMDTAMRYQPMHVRTDLGMGGEDEIELVLVPVSAETDYNMDGTLKAYWVQFVDDEWGMFIHAVSAGKAKSLFWNSYPGTDYPQWNDIRATRTKGADLLDVTPFTDDTLRYAGYAIPKPDGENYFADAFLHDCPCSMCKFELSKPGYRVDTTAQMAEAQ